MVFVMVFVFGISGVIIASETSGESIHYFQGDKNKPYQYYDEKKDVIKYKVVQLAWNKNSKSAKIKVIRVEDGKKIKSPKIRPFDSKISPNGNGFLVYGLPEGTFLDLADLQGEDGVRISAVTTDPNYTKVRGLKEPRDKKTIGQEGYDWVLSDVDGVFFMDTTGQPSCAVWFNLY